MLRQLEAGGAVARAALRKLLLSRMTLEERVAKVREEMGIPLESIGSLYDNMIMMLIQVFTFKIP